MFNNIKDENLRLALMEFDRLRTKGGYSKITRISQAISQDGICVHYFVENSRKDLYGDERRQLLKECNLMDGFTGMKLLEKRMKDIRSDPKTFFSDSLSSEIGLLVELWKSDTNARIILHDVVISADYSTGNTIYKVRKPTLRLTMPKDYSLEKRKELEEALRALLRKKDLYLKCFLARSLSMNPPFIVFGLSVSARVAEDSSKAEKINTERVKEAGDHKTSMMKKEEKEKCTLADLRQIHVDEIESQRQKRWCEDIREQAKQAADEKLIPILKKMAKTHQRVRLVELKLATTTVIDIQPVFLDKNLPSISNKLFEFPTNDKSHPDFDIFEKLADYINREILGFSVPSKKRWDWYKQV